MVLVSLVEVDRPARRRCAPDADRHGVDHLLKLLLTPPERLFGVHLIVDVVTEAVPLDDAPVLIPQRLGAARHPVIDTIGAAQAVSQRESSRRWRGCDGARRRTLLHRPDGRFL